MKLISEILPFLVLVAITLGGKWLESKKRQVVPPQTSAPTPPPVMQRQTSAPTQEVDEDEEDELEPAEVPRHPEAVRPEPPKPAPQVHPQPVPRPMSQMPPVANVPEPLRQLMKSLGVDLPAARPAVVEAPAPAPVRVAEVRQHVVEQKEEAAPVAKPVLDRSPAAVRQAMMWKAILEEPRGRRPWTPVAR